MLVGKKRLEQATVVRTKLILVVEQELLEILLGMSQRLNLRHIVPMEQIQVELLVFSVHHVHTMISSNLAENIIESFRCARQYTAHIGLEGRH